MPDDRDDLAGAARIDEDEPFAAEAVEILLDDAADQQRRDAGIERIAAARENFKSGRGRQRMTGGDAAIASRDGRAFGGPAVRAGKIGRHQRDSCENSEQDPARHGSCGAGM